MRDYTGSYPSQDMPRVGPMKDPTPMWPAQSPTQTAPPSPTRPAPAGHLPIPILTMILLTILLPIQIWQQMAGGRKESSTFAFFKILCSFLAGNDATEEALASHLGQQKFIWCLFEHMRMGKHPKPNQIPTFSFLSPPNIDRLTILVFVFHFKLR